MDAEIKKNILNASGTVGAATYDGQGHSARVDR